MLTLIGIIIIGTIILAIASVIFEEIDRKKVSDYTTSMLNQLMGDKNIQDYEWQKFGDGSILMNDYERNVLYVITADGWVSRGHEYINNVEFTIDDAMAFQSSLSSATGRAIVGGVLAGGVGAIVGGVTGKKNGKKVVNRITLTISFSTRDAPYKRITLLDNKQGVEIYSSEYEYAERLGLHWSNLITSLMNK